MAKAQELLFVLWIAGEDILVFSPSRFVMFLVNITEDAGETAFEHLSICMLLIRSHSKPDTWPHVNSSLLMTVLLENVLLFLPNVLEIAQRQIVSLQCHRSSSRLSILFVQKMSVV